MDNIQQSLCDGLQALAHSSFPKVCGGCEQEFETVEEFITKTQTDSSLSSDSGLKETRREDGVMVVELYRRCACGSTLMDAFNNRRSQSDAGEERRQNFEELLNLVGTHYELDRPSARQELLKIFHGGSSEVIKNILPKH